MEKQTNEIVKINPADFRVEESKATQIAEQFKHMLDKMVELDRLKAWVNGFELENITNVKNTPCVEEIREKFEAFKKWSINQVNNL